MSAWSVLAIVAGLCVTAVFWALTLDFNQAIRALRFRQKALMQSGIQVRLDEAQLEISADKFVRRSMLLGIGIGLAMAWVVGAVALVPLGLAAGVLITWTDLERKRDQQHVTYNQNLASACDTLRNAYLTTGSLSNAMQAVIDYGHPSLSSDFALVLTAARQGELMQGLQTIAAKRRSIVFDAVANALLRAEESSGAVGEMLDRLADATRQNVAAFEAATIMQINARSNVNWGAFGPWMIFAVFRVASSFMAGGALDLPAFFTTIAGNIIAAAAGVLTIALHRWCYRIAQRDMTVQRIATSDPASFRDGSVSADAPLFIPGVAAPAIAKRMRQRPLGAQPKEAA